jgi:hypothetical protein
LSSSGKIPVNLAVFNTGKEDDATAEESTSISASLSSASKNLLVRRETYA